MKPRVEHPAPTPLSLLTGELDEEQAREVLERAERDPEASAELDLVCDLVAAWPLVPSKAPPRRGPGALVATAAGLAAAAALLLWALRPGGPDGQDPLLRGLAAPPHYVAAELRSDSPGSPGDPRAAGTRAAFEAAMVPYHGGDHAAAEESLATFLEAHPGSSTARFYRAAALVELGRLAEARSGFERVAAEAPGHLGEHARWRLALAWLRAGEEARARAQLEELRDVEGAFAANARRLLEALAEQHANRHGE